MHHPTTVTITKQWQIYIPKSFRKMLGLTRPGKVEMRIKKQKLIITPKRSGILAIVGKYKNKKPKVKINLDRIRDYIDYSKA